MYSAGSLQRTHPDILDPLESDQPQNQIQCYHPYWNSDKGEDAWGADRSSGASSSVLVTERSGAKTQVKFNLRQEPGSKRWTAIPTVTRNGKALPINETAVVESPVLMLKSGTLEVNAAGKQLKIPR